MQAYETRRATRAALSSASRLGLTVHDAAVLHNSNKLTLRLRPCDVLARVAPAADQAPSVKWMSLSGWPRSGARWPRWNRPRSSSGTDYVVTLWAYYEPVTTRAIPHAEYADALERLHAGMRRVDLPTPHYTDRVSAAQAARGRPGPNAGAGRRRIGIFLANTLDRMRRAVSESGRPEQLLHGEPHPGNLLVTRTGPLFIDFETCCRGPIEFDLAHAPDEVGDHYPGVDHQLLRDCRTLILAMITVWRWDRDDQFPDGHRLGIEWLNELRKATAQPG